MNEYSEIHSRYESLANSEADAYKFYGRVRDDGVAPFHAATLLRDYFASDLNTGMKYEVAYNGYTTEEILTLPTNAEPDRGAYCPKCNCSIPAFRSLSPELEREIRGLEDNGRKMLRLTQLTACPPSWAKIWVMHPQGPHRVFGDTDAPNCSHCGKQLRTKFAKQCVECGADWH